jgi:hypothetical protein
MAYTDSYALANNATFLEQVRMAALYAAIQIVSETPSASNRVDEKRHALAEAVLVDGCTTKLPAIAYACAANNASGGGLTSSSVDGDIQFIVNSLWSGLAGVSAADSK